MKSLVSQIFCGRDRHSAAPMKLNDFWPKEDRLGVRLSCKDKAEQMLLWDEGEEKTKIGGDLKDIQLNMVTVR